MAKKIFLVLSVGSFVLSAFFFVRNIKFANAAIADTAAAQTTAAETKEINCQDKFKLGSVSFKQTSISPAGVANAGAKLSFSTTISNLNDYPVADGMVLARIYRVNPNKTEPKDQDFLVDEFAAANNINLWPKEEKQVQFSWQSPENSLTGNYSAKLYFISSNQFDFSGLYSSSMPSGAIVNFAIRGSNKGFWIDNNNIKIEDKKLVSLSNLIVDANQIVSFSLPIKNNAGSGAATLSYKVFKSSPFDEKNKITEKSNKILLNSEDKLLYIHAPVDEPGIYFVKISLEGDKQKSKSEIVFYATQDGIISGNFDWVNLSKFPLKKGERFSLSACFSSSQNPRLPGKVVLQLKDQKTGQVLAEAEREELIDRNISGFEMQFNKGLDKNNSGNLLLTASLYDAIGIRLSNQTLTDYNLNNFSPLPSAGANLNQILIIAALILAALIIIIAVIFIIRKVKERKMTMPKLPLFILIVSAFALLSSSALAEVRCPPDSAVPQFFCNYLNGDAVDQLCCKNVSTLNNIDNLIDATKFYTLRYDNSGDILYKGDVQVVGGEFLGPDDVISGALSSVGSWVSRQQSSKSEEWRNINTPYPYSINWVGNINNLYSWENRKCNQGENVHDAQCPNVSPMDTLDKYTSCWRRSFPDLTPEEKQNCIDEWIQYGGCDGVYTNTEFSDIGYNLNTYLTQYHFWPFGYGNACIGTQINCERDIKFTIAGPLRCTLKNGSATYVVGPDSSSDIPGPDQAKGETLNIDNCHVEGSVSEPTTATITIDNGFKCFSYLDRGIFSKIDQWMKFFNITFWESAGHDSCSDDPYEECYCKFQDLKGELITTYNEFCLGIYQPLKMIQPTPSLPSITSTYTFYIQPTNSPPSAADLTPQFTACNDPESSYPEVHLYWAFSDPDVDDTQSAYRVQIFSDSAYTNLVQDTQDLHIGNPSSSNQYSPLNLDFGRSYYWQVMVWDNKDMASSWSRGEFTTGARSPKADFDIPQGVPRQLYDDEGNPTTKVIEYTFVSKYTLGSYTYGWEFNNWGSYSISAGGVDQSSVTVRVPDTFQPTSDKKVALTVNDGSSGCGNVMSRNLTGAKVPPTWIEIPPFSKINNFLAQIISFFR